MTNEPKVARSPQPSRRARTPRVGGLSVRVLDSCAMRKLLACSVVVAVGVGVAFTPANCWHRQA